MANGSPIALNILALMFLLVPGYLSLRGYLSATIQLDTTSRLDKLLLAVLGGLVTMAFALLLNRFGIFDAAINLGYRLLGAESDPASIGFSLDNSVTIRSFESFTGLALIGFIFTQSVFGYVFGYILGTIIHIYSSQPQTSDKDLQQPWETAIRLSRLGDRVTVVTRNGQEIRGRLYRIGSPSKDYDILLEAAEQISADGENIPLGVTYHHYRDVSQVRFPQIKPQQEKENANWILRNWIRLTGISRGISERYYILRYRYDKLESMIGIAGLLALRLNRKMYKHKIRSAIINGHILREQFKTNSEEDS